MKPIVFAGSASTNLTKKIVQEQGLELGKMELVRFANSEQKVTIISEVKDKNCLIIQSTSNPTDQHLMELLLIVDALERSGARQTSCFIPYFGYSRQNIQHQAQECVSMNVVARILETFKVKEIITIDLHEEGSSGIFDMPFQNLSALPLLAEKLYEGLHINSQTEANYAVCSPDQGGVERVRLFGNSFYRSTKNYEVVMTEKKRNLDKVHESKAIELYGDVTGKEVILVDDVSTSGGTIINAAALCLNKGAKAVHSVVVHPDFAFGVAEKIQNSSLTSFWTTNTIEKTVDDLGKYQKIKVIDISKIFKIS